MIGELIHQAKIAAQNSYAPYSHFNVGAALLTKSGKIYRGCNVENASFSATVCAERTAFFNAVSAGEREFSAIAIVGGRDFEFKELTPPCGVCRQVMCEFCKPDFEIVLARADGSTAVYRLADLMPLSFELDRE